MKKLLLLTGTLTFGMIVGISANAQTINTYAGNGTYGYTGNGGAATSAELSNPSGVAEDASGNLYIADYWNNVIRMVTPTGTISTFAGNTTGGFSGDGGPATAAELDGPVAVAVDYGGNVYIADQNNERIRMVNTSGTISTFAGNGTKGYTGDGIAATAAELSLPDAIAIDKLGDVYIADLDNYRVRMVYSGIITTVAGSGIQGTSGDGGPATAADLNGITGLAVDNTKPIIYITDQGGSSVRMVGLSKNISTIAGNGTAGFSGDGGPATAAELKTPAGLWVDTASNLYIADYGNNRIRVVNSSGVITTIAGTVSGGFSGDGGPATLAKLNNPEGVCVDGKGNMYIADYNNKRVRKVNLLSGINELTDNVSVSVFPNPSTGVFTMQVSAIGHQSTVEVYNLLGEKIYFSGHIKNSTFSVNLNGQAKRHIYLQNHK